MSIPGAASPLFIGAAAAADTGYKINRSLRFERADDAYLSRTFSASNRKTWTFSCWAKLSEVGTNRELFCTPGASPWITLQIANNDKFAIYWTAGQAGTPWTSDAVFRDPSAWYHFVVAWDTTQSTASNRLKVYANGVQLTGSNNYPAHNTDYQVNSAVSHGIGGNKDELGGYLAEIHFVDGTALAASDFGEEDAKGVWQPKEYTGAYGPAGYSGTVPSSTSDVAPAGSYGNGIATAAVLFGGTILTNGQNHIRQDGGGIEWSAAISLSSGDVAGAQCLYFNNTSAHTIQFKINGSWVDVQQNAQNVIGSTQGQGALITYTASGSANWTGVKATGGSNISVTTVAGIFVNSLLVGGSGGGNGFYLKFADNSSNAALGTDSSGNSNTWTVNNLTAAGTAMNQSQTWSNGTFSSPDGNIGDTNDNPKVFDANLSNFTGCDSAAILRYEPPSSFTVSSKLEILGRETLDGTLASNRSQTFRIFTTSSSVAAYTVTNSQGEDFDAAPSNWSNGAITAMEIEGNTLNTTLVGFRVDGELLTDPGTVDTTAKNIDSLIDTPTNYTADSGNNGGNYCTLNPLESALTGINDGNLNSGSSGSAGWKICTSTMAVSSGKYYWEGFTDTTASPSQGWQWGFCNVTPSSLTNPYGTGKWSYQHNVVYSQSSSGSNVSVTAGANDLLAYALDMDAGTCKLYVNNSLVHTFTGISGTVTPFVGSYNSPTVTVNFGQRPFAYTPPTGHVSLCTQNLANPTIANGSTAFDIKTYTGNGSSYGNSQTISGLSFNPDFLWIKCRSNSSDHHLADTVNGINKNLESNSTIGNQTNNNNGYISATTSDGFTVVYGGLDGLQTNDNSKTYVAWAWDAGASTASNTDGSITTNVRASQTNGFSIATYTGNGSANQTLGHGLGASPSFVLIKDRSSSQNWAVLHTSAGTLGTLDGGTNYKLLELNANAAARDASYNTIWHPTNTTVKIGEGASSAHWTNKSGDNYVMYAWTPVEGYSAFGSYEGDNSTDGPFVYTGFRPRWVLIKNIDSSSQEWVILDAERNTFNVTGKVLYANTAGAEADLGAINDRHIDILSNGFKVNRGDPLNQSATHVFACFASHPFKTARAR
jgi:hypothetical protein